jgi:hypothetical protein
MISGKRKTGLPLGANNFKKERPFSLKPIIMNARLQVRAKLKVKTKWLVGAKAKGSSPTRFENKIITKIVKKSGKYRKALGPACCTTVVKTKLYTDSASN